MNSKDFIDEVNKDGRFIEEFNKNYEEFKYYQNKAVDTLNEFHRVCEKNNVKYQLAYGSLLGAIRDNGQIPWDYDIDVFVPFSEKNALITALQKDLSTDYYFYCPEVDKKCRHVIMRLAPKGFRTEVLHVDVFFLIAVANDEKVRNEEINEIKNIASKRYDKLVRYIDEKRSLKDIIKKFIKKIRTVNYDPEKMYEKYEELCKEHNIYEAKYLVSADSFADDYLFPADMFKEDKLIKIDTGVFRIPLDYDEILKIQYGDYTKIFPLEERIKEMMNAYNRLVRFAKK